MNLNMHNAIKSLLWAATLFFSQLAGAASLDAAVADDAVLLELSEALGAYDIDVTSNLNARDVISQRIRRPRLGRFPDLPVATYPSSYELALWEEAYEAGEVGAIAMLVSVEDDPNQDFASRWLSSSSGQRLFVTFYREDIEAAQTLLRVASAYGYASEKHFQSESSTTPGRLYATAAQRLAIDSREARRYRTDVTEMSYLGERVRRRSNSLFRDDGNRGDGSLARREPSVFMKETLGDEFNQSTISEIVVPGGVALGETARSDLAFSELVFEQDRLSLIDDGGVARDLPSIELADAKTLFDFVNRSEAIRSDAIVDIDGDGRVRISSAFRDTDAGFAIMHADTQPFEYVPNLPVTKSVVIDTGVQWYQEAQGNALQFQAEFEVRFLSADNMRIAQTRAALVYDYDSASKNAEYSDSWGRDVRRLHESLDYSGLGESMLKVADYAGWVGLFRLLQQDEVPFLRGRYEFMKIDKTGQKTPIRY